MYHVIRYTYSDSMNNKNTVNNINIQDKTNQILHIKESIFAGIAARIVTHPVIS